MALVLLWLKLIFSRVDIGTKITDTINASMGESVELHPNFTVVPGNIDTSSLTSAITESVSALTGEYICTYRYQQMLRVL